MTIPPVSEMWSRVREGRVQWLIPALIGAALLAVVLLLSAARGMIGDKVIRRRTVVPTGKRTNRNHEADYHERVAEIEGERADRAAARGGALPEPAELSDRLRRAAGRPPRGGSRP